MKVSSALVACNENTKYLEFWPVVKRSWWEIIGLPCVMVYVGESLPECLKEDSAVIHFKPIDSWPTATQAQVIRLLYPALLKCDGAVVLSDMDMIPLQRDFFINGFKKFETNQIVSLRGIDENEKQIYMCYVGATPQTWAELFQIRTKEDIYNVLKTWSAQTMADGTHGGLGWCSDQLILYEKVKGWQQSAPERVGLVPWTSEIPRLDRGQPYEWIQWSPLLEVKLQGDAYVDFHMPSYAQFKQQIDSVLDYIVRCKNA